MTFNSKHLCASERERGRGREKDKKNNSIRVMHSEISLAVQKVVKCSPSVFLSSRNVLHIYYLKYPGSAIIKLNSQNTFWFLFSHGSLNFTRLSRQLKRDDGWCGQGMVTAVWISHLNNHHHSTPSCCMGTCPAKTMLRVNSTSSVGLDALWNTWQFVDFEAPIVHILKMPVV